jgi:hypothetical protein
MLEDAHHLVRVKIFEFGEKDIHKFYTTLNESLTKM